MATRQHWQHELCGPTSMNTHATAPNIYSTWTVLLAVPYDYQGQAAITPHMAYPLPVSRVESDYATVWGKTTPGTAPPSTIWAHLISMDANPASFSDVVATHSTRCAPSMWILTTHQLTTALVLGEHQGMGQSMVWQWLPQLRHWRRRLGRTRRDHLRLDDY